MNAQSKGQTAIAPVRQQVVVNAPVERAFSIFTAGFGTWWPKGHTISPVPVELAIIEPFVGGRCYDRATDGSECDWGRVLAWEPPVRLVLAWQIDGTWTYEPEVENSSRVTISFVPDGDRTEVTLVHDEFERHLTGGADLAAAVAGGWSVPLEEFVAAVARDQAQPEQAQAEAAQPEPAQARPAMKYVLTYHAVEDFAPLAQLHYPAHSARVQAFHDRGDLLMVGLLHEPMNGESMAVFASKAAAREFVADDPFVLNKVIATWTIRPWMEIFHTPTPPA